MFVFQISSSCFPSQGARRMMRTHGKVYFVGRCGFRDQAQSEGVGSEQRFEVMPPSGVEEIQNNAKGRCGHPTLSVLVAVIGHTRSPSPPPRLHRDGREEPCSSSGRCCPSLVSRDEDQHHPLPAPHQTHLCGRLPTPMRQTQAASQTSALDGQLASHSTLRLPAETLAPSLAPSYPTSRRSNGGSRACDGEQDCVGSCRRRRRRVGGCIYARPAAWLRTASLAMMPKQHRGGQGCRREK